MGKREGSIDRSEKLKEKKIKENERDRTETNNESHIIKHTMGNIMVFLWDDDWMSLQENRSKKKVKTMKITKE